jgi:hypothetical protein
MVREPRVRGTSAVGSPYRAMTGEVKGERKDLTLVVVNRRVCELAIAL